MKWLTYTLLFLAVHFTMTPFAPAEKGKWLLWPIDGSSRPVFAMLGGLPQHGNGLFTTIAAGTAALALLVGFLAKTGWIFPAQWATFSIAIGCALSIVLFLAYFSPLSILPIAVDVCILWLVITKKL